MSQANHAPSTPTPSPASGEGPFLPTRPMPLAQPVGTTGWLPLIRHPDRPEFVTYQRFPRKAKADPHETMAYAGPVLACPAHFAPFKPRPRDATAHPRHL